MLAEAIRRLMAGGVAGRVEIVAAEPEPREEQPRDPALRPLPEPPAAA